MVTDKLKQIVKKSTLFCSFCVWTSFVAIVEKSGFIYAPLVVLDFVCFVEVGFCLYYFFAPQDTGHEIVSLRLCEGLLKF